MFKLGYRDVEEEFLVSEVLRKALNLKKVPHYSTICKAVKKLKEEDLKKLLEESSVGRKVRYFSNRLYWVKGRQFKLLLR